MEINHGEKRHGLVFYSSLVLLLVCPLVFNPASVFFYEFFQVVFFRSLVSVLVLLAVHSVFKKKKISSVRIPKYFLYLVFAFLVFSGVSTILADSPNIAFWGSSLRFQGYVNILHYVAYFFILIFLIRKTEVKILLKAVSLSAFLVGLYAIAQRLGMDPWSMPVRVFSTFGHPNFLAAYLAMTVPITLYFILQRKSRAFAAISLYVQCTALFLTFTRSAWAAAFFASLFVFVFIIFLYRKDKFFLKKIFTVFVLTIAIAALSFVSAREMNKGAGEDYMFFATGQRNSFDLNGNPLDERLKDMTEFHSGSGAIRVFIWKDALDIIKDYPLFGVGADNMQETYAKHYRDEPDRPEASREMIADRAHNEIMDAWISYGIFGMIAFFGIIVFVFIVGFSGFKNRLSHDGVLMVVLMAGILGYVVFNQFGFAVTATYILFWTFAALIFKLSFKEDFKAVKFSFKNKKFVFVLSALVICFIIIVVNLMPAAASVYAAAYYKSKNITEWQEKDLKRAIALAPYEQHYHFLLASLYNSAAIGAENGVARAEFFRKAIDELNTAHELGLDDLNYYTSLAAVYDRWSEYDDSVADMEKYSLQKARESAPNFSI
ncbi:MAG: hypothetical protein ACD_63C00158G0007 [uncultured bacterium]|nr:MAG: hypothetical protein ACD_63C00158G0007 [uncultured bacterium]